LIAFHQLERFSQTLGFSRNLPLFSDVNAFHHTGGGMRVRRQGSEVIEPES